MDPAPDAPATPDTGIPGRIAEIEDALEALADAGERCRKTWLAARAGCGAGIALLCLGFWRGDAILLVFGIAAALGGFVLAGATGTTRADLAARADTLAAERDGLIDGLRL